MQNNALPKITMGLDVSDRFTSVAVLDAEGEVIERSRLVTTAHAFERRFAGATPIRVVLEAGKHSPWISRLLTHLGHEVFVANARRVKLVWAADNKSDPVDAESLARLGRLDPQLLAPIQHRSAEAQQHLALLRARAMLVGARTDLINHVRGVVKSCGERLPRCSADAFARRARRTVPTAIRPALDPLLDTIDELTARVRSYDQEVERVAKTSYPATVVLRQVAGVGPLTSLAFVLTLEEPNRFRNGRAVGAYLGLCPRRSQSALSDPQLRITKAGDAFVRRLLVGSAQYILGPFGPDTDLRRYGLRICARGGKIAKKRAVVAVARKLAALLYALWRTGAVYEPLRHTERTAAAAA